jgi:hypothetical protein
MKKQIALILAFTLTNLLIALERHPNQLGFAVIKGSPDDIRGLIRAGADVNAATKFGQTPLMVAAIRGNVEIVKILLENHAGIYPITNNGETALELAVTRNNIQAAQLLLESLTAFTKLEQDALKNWLRFAYKMKTEKGIVMPKDIRKLVGRNIYQTFAQDMLQRIIKAGGQKALYEVERMLALPGATAVQKREYQPMVTLIRNYLDINFLEKLARTQSNIPQFMQPNKSEIQESEMPKY